jgi:exodeoxyribonuclease VII large subunit
MDTIIYTPDTLNLELLNETNLVAVNYKNIKLIGDIIECKLLKNKGISFKITNSKSSFECIIWFNIKKKDEILSFENKNCIIEGDISAQYYYNHKFILNVKSIELESDQSNLKKLKDIVIERKYYDNKKEINWGKIRKIGIISKKETQGYNDFMKQFDIPIEINLEEISLEGQNTCNECINAIKNLQENDIIIIIRGGGSTSEISNSFDKIELYTQIKNSNIPIISAIGHEADKGDKLLITEITDKDFPTPSTASYEIKKKLLENKYLKNQNEIDKIKLIIEEKINEKKDELVDILKCLINLHYEEKMGGPIIKLTKNYNKIIIEKDGNYYENIINYDNKIDINNDEINEMNNILDNLDRKLLDKVKDNKIIKNKLSKIKKLEELEKSYLNCKEYKIEEFYLKKIIIKNKKVDKLIEIYSLLLYYKINLELDKEIFNYYTSLE